MIFLQGQTIRAGTKVIIHWSTELIVGMAYVMLGRSESIRDIFITGEFSITQIKCDLDALAESNRLEELFNDTVKEERKKSCKCWKISFLNVRSMKSSDGHRIDVAADNLLMDSDLFGLGETWLEEDNKVDYPGFFSHFANFGKGKGLAGYNKINVIEEPKTVTSETYSTMLFKTAHFHIIFLYLSSNCKKAEVISLLDMWIQKDTPTAIIGDINENLVKLKKITFSKQMASRGFEQLIKEPTCETGSLIDHVYVNNAMKAQGISTKIDGAYYSDHDIVSLWIPKSE